MTLPSKLEKSMSIDDDSSIAIKIVIELIDLRCVYNKYLTWRLRCLFLRNFVLQAKSQCTYTITAFADTMHWHCSGTLVALSLGKKCLTI